MHGFPFGVWLGVMIAGRQLTCAVVVLFAEAVTGVWGGEGGERGSLVW